LGFDIFWDKKIHPTIGLSLYGSFLLNSSDYSKTEFIQPKNGFNMGLNVSGGIGYKINSRYYLSLTYQMNLLDHFKKEVGSPSGYQYIEPVLQRRGFLNFCLSYKLKR
jgi:hypothetical protein